MGDHVGIRRDILSGAPAQQKARTFALQCCQKHFSSLTTSDDTSEYVIGKHMCIHAIHILRKARIMKRLNFLFAGFSHFTIYGHV